MLGSIIFMILQLLSLLLFITLVQINNGHATEVFVCVCVCWGDDEGVTVAIS